MEFQKLSILFEDIDDNMKRADHLDFLKKILMDKYNDTATRNDIILNLLGIAQKWSNSVLNDFIELLKNPYENIEAFIKALNDGKLQQYGLTGTSVGTLGPGEILGVLTIKDARGAPVGFHGDVLIGKTLYEFKAPSKGNRIEFMLASSGRISKSNFKWTRNIMKLISSCNEFKNEFEKDKEANMQTKMVSEEDLEAIKLIGSIKDIGEMGSTVLEKLRNSIVLLGKDLNKKKDNSENETILYVDRADKIDHYKISVDDANKIKANTKVVLNIEDSKIIDVLLSDIKNHPWIENFNNFIIDIKAPSIAFVDSYNKPDFGGVVYIMRGGESFVASIEELYKNLVTFVFTMGNTKAIFVKNPQKENYINDQINLGRS
jgi:hypothetical protein